MSPVGVYREENGCGPCHDSAMNSEAMAGYTGVAWQCVAGDPWFLSTNGIDDWGEYEAGCWLGIQHYWEQGLKVYSSHCNMCQSSYLCSTNLAKAAPSPAPTTAVPTISAAPTMDVCSSVGEFEYEGHTLYCLEVEGELHNILHIEDGAKTCDVRDANSSPNGFDIWVPRSYEHARAVLSLRGYNSYDDDLDDEEEGKVRTTTYYSNNTIIVCI